MTIRARTILSFLLAVLLTCALPSAAFAEKTAGEEAKPYQILKGETDIEKLTDKLAEARVVLDETIAQVEEMQKQIDEIETQIPGQQARSDAGMKQRYIMQSNPLIVLDSLLGVSSLDDFIRQSEYWMHVSNANLKELNRLVEMRAKLDEARAERDLLRAEAQKEVDEAAEALEEEQSERAENQAECIEEARNQVGTYAPDDEESADNEDSDEDEDSDDEDSDEGSDEESDEDEESDDEESDEDEDADEDSSKSRNKIVVTEEMPSTDALNDGANWYAPREEFIGEWTERIDKYLEGTALEGQGKAFAEAAWKHNVDPRWSPAISFTESSNGAVCIRPHNAWGWGAADSDPYNLASEWGSWEEAIDAHVAGLAKGYGYTISLSNARKYCPPNWLLWYNRTLGQMEKI